MRSGWAKFKELAPILTSRGASLKVKGRVYRTCVQRVLVYGSETWPVKVEDMQRLERTERMMVSWMCGVSLKSRMLGEKLNARLGIEAISEVVRRGRLRWYGHLERKSSDDWVSSEAVVYCYLSVEVITPNLRTSGPYVSHDDCSNYGCISGLWLIHHKPSDRWTLSCHVSP